MSRRPREREGDLAREPEPEVPHAPKVPHDHESVDIVGFEGTWYWSEGGRLDP